jgi:hypothetical protein
MREIDKDGNILYIANDGIFLKLKTELQPRKIFSFYDRSIVKFVKKSNIMKPDSKVELIGFNYNALRLINDSKFIKNKQIVVRIGLKNYTITPDEVLNYKEFLHFKQSGFELQCFYPINKLERKLIGTQISRKGN